MIDRSDPVWFKDAIVYQLHVKAFYDANGDGIGDFEGLIQKLDYIQSLGVTAIWLLPFYPSPLRDDGYDIADYRNVNPAYGKMTDFRRLIREAHRRGLRVITELVVNHTSDQHPWFQRARRAKPGSAARDFYVWSDSDQRFKETRIIFLDTEASNWAWDPEAQAYYWHRFYSHQPDLNYDNPRVLKEVLNVLRFWFDMGVDGLRLDAVPYLIEREGTNNENLPETHDILRKIRAEVDANYPDRMLLAEANQWPEDTQEYFGKGDECHMAFHFPLMPRMYMGIAQEDRHPITDIMRQTPEIPANCQWAVFLRNHDELTLEMVTDEERDYLWNFYAADRRMRINLGIRRRLAPLLGRDRRKIQLMNGLLLSMPGTPIIYYGDEIGMGDNIYLGDRDGVRTPMQWSPDRNAGFSRANPQRLFLPAIMDSVYGYEAVNVESQQGDDSSLLHWMKRLIKTREAHRAFGRGGLRFLYPGNRKILAFLREHEEEVVLCVANLSRSPQAVELDLSEFRGRIPVELSGHTPFPPVGDLTYLLTLGAYEFYWFVLSTEAGLPKWHRPPPPPLPEFMTLVMRGGWESLLAGRERERLEREILPNFLPNHRWFAGKDKRIARAALMSTLEIVPGLDGLVLAQVEVAQDGRDSQRYLLPLGIAWTDDAMRPGSALLSFTLAKVRRFRKVGALFDASAGDALPRALLAAMRQGAPIEKNGVRIQFRGSDRLADLDLPADVAVRRFGREQSNTTVVLGDQVVLKLYRKLVSGPHPELEIGHFLASTAGFSHTPPFLGSIEQVEADGTCTALGILQKLVFNQGDGWTFTLNYLERHLEAANGGERRNAPYFDLAGLLGRRTAELHAAFCTPTEDKAFRAEPIQKKDMNVWRRALKQELDAAFQAVRAARSSLGPAEAALADRLLSARQACQRRIDALTADPVRAARTRVHGDYHLGQVLVAEADFHIIDFEGEPSRPLVERRRKTSAAKDVAGMLRSFDYVAQTAAQNVAGRFRDREPAIRAAATTWRDRVAGLFLDAYREAIQGQPCWPEDAAEANRLVEIFLLEKALYEISYEAANRPAWLAIPIAGVLALLASAPGKGPSA